LASPSSFLTFLGGWEDGRSPGGLPKQHHRRPRVHVSRRVPLVLAWTSPGASLGVSKDAPPSGWARDVHSCSVPPWLSPRFRLASACSRQGAGLVPPSWFPTTLTVFSVVRPAGLLHPAADPGVRRVAALPAQVPRHPCVPDLPRRSPFEASPRPHRSAVSPRFSRTHALLSFTEASCSCERSRLDSRAFLHGSGSRVSSGLAASGPVQLPWVSSSLAFRHSALLPTAPEGDGLAWGDPRTRRGEPRRSRCSVLLPASPPRGGGALASYSIEVRFTRNRSLPSISPGPPRSGSWTSLELAGGGSCQSVLTSPWGGAEDGGDGDEEGVGFSGAGCTTGRVPSSPEGPGPGGPPLDFCRTGVDRHLVSPTGRTVGPRASLDGFEIVRTRGPSQPEVGTCSILVTPWNRFGFAGDGDHPRAILAILASPASPGSCRRRCLLVEWPPAGGREPRFVAIRMDRVHHRRSGAHAEEGVFVGRAASLPSRGEPCRGVHEARAASKED